MNLFPQYSYRKKKLAAVMLFVVLGIAAYKRSYSVTIDLINLNSELKIKRDEAEKSKDQLMKKQKEILIVNQIIGKENIPNEIVQQAFLSFVDSTGTGVQVERMEEVYRYDHPDFIINTNEITIKGNYSSSLKFIYSLEKNFNYARLVSLRYFTKHNREKNTDELFVTLLLQNFSGKG